MNSPWFCNYVDSIETQHCVDFFCSDFNGPISALALKPAKLSLGRLLSVPMLSVILV